MMDFRFFLALLLLIAIMLMVMSKQPYHARQVLLISTVCENGKIDISDPCDDHQMDHLIFKDTQTFPTPQEI